MSEPLKLSHSARGKFDHCPAMYDLHYNKKIRPTGTTSALLFGSAMDKACEHYMLNRNVGEARQLFRDTWNEQEINGKLTDLSTSLEVNFHNNDYDRDLLTESDNERIIKDTVYATVSDLLADGVEKERIAYSNWISLYRKGQLMLKSFISWVDENVAEVLGCQLPIELEDEEGNKVPGLADFVIKVNGYDNPVLVDLKTSARPYERSSVKESEQLALYFLYLKGTKFPTMERSAYLVLSKQIKKNRVKTCQKCGTVTTGREKTCAVGEGKDRCKGEFTEVTNPECNIQYIHDEIPESFITETIEKFNIAVNKIKEYKETEFPKNLEGCDKYYGRECPYKQFCLTGCMNGLFKKESE